MITTWLIQHFGLPLLKFGGIALAILGTILTIRQWGKAAEKSEQYQNALKNSFDRAKINANVASGIDTGDNWLRAPEARN